MDHIAWMAWTLPTAIFFVMLASTLGVMTWLAVAYPEAERVGVLRIPTTRGDRLFISLVLAAVIHLVLERSFEVFSCTIRAKGWVMFWVRRQDTFSSSHIDLSQPHSSERWTVFGRL